jgi:oligoendopeptidase F
MTAYVLNREIDNIRGTLFRQTMFAEFEKITHQMAEEHTPLTVDSLTGEYEKLLGVYFGDSMALDRELRLECLRIPHFYSAFYVYKYATGISAAIALAQKVLEEGSPARDAYLGFLGMGGSKYPLDELLDAGVDLRSPKPVESAIGYFESLARRFLEIYKTMGRT